jgi:two-component system cell cycle response regulator DivK
MLLNGKHIFIVEDNLQNRVIFQMSLIRHGAIVDFERWGKDALYRLQHSSHLDAIVLDLMLADGYSGFDIFDEIRAQPKFDPIPIVAVSAMDPSVAVPRVRSQGFAGFIAKPIDNRLFPQQLARIIDGEQVWYMGGE